MGMYNAAVEVATTEYDVDAAMEALADYHVAVGQSAREWVTTQLGLPTESIAQATSTVCAVVAQVLAAHAIASEVLTETEFNARQWWATVPDLVSVSEAAEQLGVSRQRMLQRIDAKSLPATRVSRDFVIPRLRSRRIRSPRDVGASALLRSGFWSSAVPYVDASVP